MQQPTTGKLHITSQIRTWLLAKSSATPISDNTILRDAKQKASFTAAFINQLPYTLIEYGVIFLIVGLTLYLGFAWRRKIDTEHWPNGNRNKFIMFIICPELLCLQWAWAFYSKSVWLEQKIAAGDSKKCRTTPDVVPNALHMQTINETINESSGSLGTEVERKPFGAFYEPLRQAAESHRKHAEADLLVRQYKILAAEK